MSKLFTVLFSIFSITVFAQPNVFLRFEHMVDGNVLEFDQEYTEPNQGYEFSITRLQYYISEISITHDGGQETMIEDTWLLVNADEQMDYALGKHNVTQVESISFYVGVDPDHNHLDPTTFPSGHSLAPQNPSMHWGWSAGYRFVCLEGKTGFNLLFTYEIHALGDDNYFQSSLPTTAIWEGDDLVIILNADYIGMYTDINVSTGLIEHGETGAAATLLENFSTEVFSQILFTGTEENENRDLINLYPNPSYNGSITIDINSSETNADVLIITDITGKKAASHYISNVTNFSMDQLGKGIYFVQLWGNGSLLQTEKLVVAK
jgi:hypothetical protein